MFKAIEAVSDHTLTPFQGVEYLLYQIPTVLLYCLPISTLIGSVFFFRQMSLSSELVAIFVSGIPFRRVLVPVAMVGCLMSVFFFATQQSAAPWASTQLRLLTEKTHFDENTTMVPQVTFMERSQAGVIDKFILISPKTVGNQARFIFLIYQGQEKDNSLTIGRIVTANHGQWSSKRGMWKLANGIDYTLDSQGVYTNVHTFNTQWIQTSAIPMPCCSFPVVTPPSWMWAS